MTQRRNKLGQALGNAIENWQVPPVPPQTQMQGRVCRLEPVDSECHGRELYEAFIRDGDKGNWTYLGIGPFDDFESFDNWIRGIASWEDPLFHAVIDVTTHRAVGVASYLRINPQDGVIEVGHIHFSPLLQRTTLATEAMYLMMKRVFDELGYRRYEWKCDSLNEPSRKAALRLGYTFEGIFRQATMYKGRNRDTAWYAIIDKDWPVIRSAYESWLDPGNFDARGNQVSSLNDLMQEFAK
jgi:RimJ/RimL family protein N-acetyltransferase